MQTSVTDCSQSAVSQFYEKELEEMEDNQLFVGVCEVLLKIEGECVKKFEACFSGKDVFLMIIG